MLVHCLLPAEANSTGIAPRQDAASLTFCPVILKHIVCHTLGRSQSWVDLAQGMRGTGCKKQRVLLQNPYHIRSALSEGKPACLPSGLLPVEFAVYSWLRCDFSSCVKLLLQFTEACNWKAKA